MHDGIVDSIGLFEDTVAVCTATRADSGGAGGVCATRRGKPHAEAKGETTISSDKQQTASSKAEQEPAARQGIAIAVTCT